MFLSELSSLKIAEKRREAKAKEKRKDMPIWTGSSFPFCQSFPSWSFHKTHPYPSKGRQTENFNHRKQTKLITWTTTLSSSMKLWAMLRRVTQDWQVVVESFDKTWSTGEWMENHFSILQKNPEKNHMNSMKWKKDRTPKDELPRLVGAQYATGDQWRNNCIKNEEMKPKQKHQQLWMWLVIEIKSDAVKRNIA